MCECSSVQSGNAHYSEVSAAADASADATPAPAHATPVAAAVVQFWSLRACGKGPGDYSFFSILIIILKRIGVVGGNHRPALSSSSRHWSPYVPTPPSSMELRNLQFGGRAVANMLQSCTDVEPVRN